MRVGCRDLNFYESLLQQCAGAILVGFMLVESGRERHLITAWFEWVGVGSKPAASTPEGAATPLRNIRYGFAACTNRLRQAVLK